METPEQQPDEPPATLPGDEEAEGDAREGDDEHDPGSGDEQGEGDG